MSRPRRLALVPIKGFARAKSRLADAMGRESRVLLAKLLAARVVAALRDLEETGDVDGIVVMSDSDEVARWARGCGCRFLADPPGRDLAEVVDHGLSVLHEEGVGQVLVVMADLPDVTPDALRVLVDRPPPAAAPDHHGTGTNALLVALPPPGPTSFGAPDSLARHRALLGQELVVVEIPGLALDLDQPDDLPR